jgi:hypothetical protein
VSDTVILEGFEIFDGFLLALRHFGMKPEVEETGRSVDIDERAARRRLRRVVFISPTGRQIAEEYLRGWRNLNGVYMILLGVAVYPEGGSLEDAIRARTSS